MVLTRRKRTPGKQHGKHVAFLQACGVISPAVEQPA